MKKLFGLCVLLGLATWSARAQQPRPAGKAQRLVLPVSPGTGRVTYSDTVRVPNATAKNLLNAVADTYAKSFVFADYQPGLPDSAQVLRTRQKADPGEYLMLGTAMMMKPGEEIVYVAGVSPLANLEAPTPVRYLHFVLRLRAEPGVCYLSITELHQRTTTMKREMERRMAGYSAMTQGHKPTTPTRPPASTPIETLYETWLPGYKVAPASKTPPQAGKPTLQDAQLLDRTARGVLVELRQNLMRQGRSVPASNTQK